MMGRSLLSVKLAFGFGLAVAVLVQVAESTLPGAREAMPAVEHTAKAEAQPRVVTAEPCLWRGCPSAGHPMLSYPDRVGRGAPADRAS
jgi:hypothetical protein